MVVWVLNGEKVKSVATHLGSLGTETISKLSTFVFYFTKSLQVLGFLWLIIQYNDNIYCHHKWVSGYLWRWNCHRVSPVSPLSSDILPKVTGGHKWIARSTRNSFLTSNVSPNWVPTKHEMSQKASFDENADSCRLQNSQMHCMSNLDTNLQTTQVWNWKKFCRLLPWVRNGQQAHHVLYTGQHKSFTSLLLIMSPIVIITIPYTGLSKCNIDIYTLRHWGSFIKSMSEYFVSLVSGISSVDFSLFSLQEAVQKYLWELLK